MATQTPEVATQKNKNNNQQDGSVPCSGSTAMMLSTDKWVKNLSGVSLTKGQVFLLACGPNLTITPIGQPLGEYIATVEQACLSLKPYEAEILIAEIRGTLKHSYTPRSYITKEESKALKELRVDETRVILTTDKSVVLVVMDKPEYTSKAHVLLEDEKTYQDIKNDPTNKYKKRLINLLKQIKAEGGINDTLYKKMYPTGAAAPKLYGLPKIHKRGIISPSDL